MSDKNKLGVSDATESLAEEVYALLDSIGATHMERCGDIVAYCRDGSIWVIGIPYKVRNANE